MEFIGISYADKRIFIRKPATWDDFLEIVWRQFRIIASSLRVLYCDDMTSTSPRWEIDEPAWPGVGHKSSLHLEVAHDTQDDYGGQGGWPSSTGGSGTALVERPDEEYNIFFNLTHLGVEEVKAFKIKRHEDILGLFTDLWEKRVWRIQASPGGMRFNLKGQRLQVGDTPATMLLEDGDEIMCLPEQTGAKPAIYLLSPIPLQSIMVSVGLCPEWEFTIIYPIAHKTKNTDTSTSTATWVVSVQADGTLVNEHTGRKSSYLFWEASSVPNNMTQLSPAKEHNPTFSPANASEFLTSDYTTATLPFDKLEPYLDRILEGLTLTPAMRTEFIVYWLPSFQRIRDRGEDIQFTFVPQDAFNKAATLTISGAAPKAVARVFLLFRGVKHDELEESEKQHDSTTGPTYEVNWPHVIGLDVRGMEDESAFRVLEWGGMEVVWNQQHR